MLSHLRHKIDCISCLTRVLGGLEGAMHCPNSALNVGMRGMCVGHGSGTASPPPSSIDSVAGPSPGVENGTTGGFLWLVEAHRRGRISKIRARLYLRSEEVVTAMAADRGAHRECASASWSLKKWVTRPGGTP